MDNNIILKLDSIINELKALNVFNDNIKYEINNLINNLEKTIDNINDININEKTYIEDKKNDELILNAFTPYIIYHRMLLNNN